LDECTKDLKDKEELKLPEVISDILGMYAKAEVKQLEFELKEDYKKLIDERYEDLSRSKYSSSYIDFYPENDTTHQDNAKFYKGTKPSQTEGGMIDAVHRDFHGAYEMLEYRHNYIQWLFPIREAGMASVQPMTKNESEQFKNSPEMQSNLIKSYELMLDFYGFVLKDKKTGELERSQNWKSRFRNLSDHSHNYLRITRIMKCLGICGLENLKKNFIKCFITEVFVNDELTETKEFFDQILATYS